MDLKIKRYLKNEKTELKPIIFKISFGYRETDPVTQTVSYKPLVYNSQIKVSKNNWVAEHGLPARAKDVAELVRIEEVIRNTYKHLELNSVEITPQNLAHELDKILGRSTKNANEVIRICDYIDNVMQHDPNRSKDNQAQYRYLKAHIIDFEKKKGITVTTKNLNREMYLQFMDKMRSQLKTANGVWKYDKNFKSMLNEIRKKFPELNVFDPSKALKTDEKPQAAIEEKLFMNFEQIQMLLNYQPQTECMQNVKLIMIKLLFCGCRYSDVFKINPDFEYSKDGLRFRYSRFVDQKTGTDIIVPFLKPLEDSLAENNGKLPYQITQGKFNTYAKELARLAKLDEEITLSFTNSQGKKEYSVKRFCEFVSSHVGRRSFITNLINYVPDTILSKITGHALKNKSVMFSYNKISLLDNAALFVKKLKEVAEHNPKDFPVQLV